MSIDAALLGRVLDAVAEAVIAHADELTALDQAIGDGDHGINMRRGFEAVLADRASILAKPLPEALRSVGTILVMKVGGASGPLYGTLALTLGKELSGSDTSAAAFARAFGTAVEAVKARGKSDTGQKTMLDVLVPVAQAIPNLSAADLAALAHAKAQETVPMKAIRGRASFLGDRSIGHMDPGARSASLMLAAACAVLEEQA